MVGIGLQARSLLAILAVCLALVGGCGDDGESTSTPPTSSFSAGVATDWYRLAVDLVQGTPGFSPPVAARALGYTGVALYEAVLPGMPGFRTFSGQLNGLGSLPSVDAGTLYHWPAVANAACASILRQLFPSATEVNRARIDAMESAWQAEAEEAVGTETARRSAEHGRAVADAVFAWSRSDGGHEGYLRNFPTDYVPPVGPGLWVPTGPAFQRALQPYWGANRPFVLPAGDACNPGPPPPYSTDPESQFYAEGLEVYETAQTLTEEQQEIALFWADDAGLTYTPPGHSISILTQILERDEHNLEVAAESYARLGIGVADAFISCWNAKFEYNLLRPVTYVQETIDPDWQSLLTTPPFPEYTSGHSVQSGASAEILTALFGAIPFVDRTHEPRLPARSFESFFDAADEAAISRLYGGIHFRSAIEVGVEQGVCVGSAVNGLQSHR